MIPPGRGEEEGEEQERKIRDPKEEEAMVANSDRGGRDGGVHQLV